MSRQRAELIEHARWMVDYLIRTVGIDVVAEQVRAHRQPSANEENHD